MERVLASIQNAPLFIFSTYAPYPSANNDQILMRIYLRQSTQRIPDVLTEVKNSVPNINTSWTHFQSPFVVEDALGFKFPVPSEYDYNTLNLIIQHRFRTGAGASEVKAGRYQLLKSRLKNDVVSENTRLLPGTEITMAIITSSTAPEYDQCSSRGSSATIRVASTIIN